MTRLSEQSDCFWRYHFVYEIWGGCCFNFTVA